MRLVIVSGSYLNYQNGAVRNQLTDGRRGERVCWDRQVNLYPAQSHATVWKCLHINLPHTTVKWEVKIRYSRCCSLTLSGDSPGLFCSHYTKTAFSYVIYTIVNIFLTTLCFKTEANLYGCNMIHCVNTRNYPPQLALLMHLNACVTQLHVQCAYNQ
jgi:hypothetical protein